MGKIKIGLLGKIIIAIILGVGAGFIFPDGLSRIFITINGLFSNFLGFIIPLIIIGLIVPGIADLGRNAGRLLLITSVLAYVFTLFSGFFTFFSCKLAYPILLSPTDVIPNLDIESIQLVPYFSLEMPPLMDVMASLLFAFIFGLGIAFIKGNTIKKSMEEFKEIINKVISNVVIPFLPVYIFGIFLDITLSGKVGAILSVFIKIIVFIFILTVILLLIQFIIAGVIAKKNPFTSLKNMLTAYITALGTQSSAATIPVTLQQTLKNDVDEDIAGFVIPLCATIHLSGSTLKITACAMAVMILNGLPIDTEQFVGFIFMLGITMIAAPGVPGGAIMAALGILASMLHFDQNALGLMIALYIAMDSFGTACNVTGDGAIAMIVDKIYKNKKRKEGLAEA